MNEILCPRCGRELMLPPMVGGACNRCTRERVEERSIIDLVKASSVGDAAWVDCEKHGRQARDPFNDRCIRCDLESTDPEIASR